MKKDSSDVVMACLGWVFAIPVILIGGYLVNGYVLSVMWGWFVVPVFHLPNLTILTAIGISMTVGFLTHQSQETSDKKKSSSEILVQAMINIFFGPLLVLVIAWFIHLFM